MQHKIKRLTDIQTGDKCLIIKVNGHGGLRKHLVESGFVKGTIVEVNVNKLLSPTIGFTIKGGEVSLRRSEAAFVEVIEWQEAYRMAQEFIKTPDDDDLRQLALNISKTIKVAYVGQMGHSTAPVSYKSYEIISVCMPYNYALPVSESCLYDTEGAGVLPDVIVNVIDASELEQHLWFTTHLIDMNIRVVLALKNAEQLVKQGDVLDCVTLSKLLGVPIVPINNQNGKDELWEIVIKLYEGSDILDKEGNLIPGLSNDALLDKHHHQIDLSHKHHTPLRQSKRKYTSGESDLDDAHGVHAIVRHIHINYGASIERAIEKLKTEIFKNEKARDEFAPRYLLIKLLERNGVIENFVRQFVNYKEIINVRNEAAKSIQNDLLVPAEKAIDDARKGFIHGALKETLKSSGKSKKTTLNDKIDAIVTHKFWGYVIFVFAIYIIFQATFSLGVYPMQWIESLVDWTGNALLTNMKDGMLKDMLIDGIIGGVGGVLVFLPNILILYFFLTLMETSGYMARAAFIMDTVMHRIGLHGRSFIPLIMGFGCNVPAIMATRSIRNRNSRMITILINPLMSCSARLPIYILLAGAFFPAHAGLILFAIYFTGIALAAVLSLIFKHFLFSKDENPYVMELPPYRIPSLQSILRDTWDKGYQYLKKIGTVILLGSVIIWALSYFPRHSQTGKGVEFTAEMKKQQQEDSYLGDIGKFISPALKPLGFDWKISIALLTGVASKEIVVSTLGVLYNADVEDGDNTLSQRLRAEKRPDGSPAFTSAIALSLMIFVLIYFPCIATIVTIRHETGSWRWALFSVFYTIALAWIMSFIVYQSIAYQAVQEVAVAIILFVAVVITIHMFRKSLQRKHGCNGCTACNQLRNKHSMGNCTLRERKFRNKK